MAQVSSRRQKIEGLASQRRPQAQRLLSWCTVASLQLAKVSSRRRRKGSSRIVAHTQKKSNRQTLPPYSKFSDFAFRAQLNGKDYVDPCELTHAATSTSRSTHAHVRIILSYDRSAKYIEYFMSYVKKRAGDSNSSAQFSFCSRQFVVSGGDIFGAYGRTPGTPVLDTRAIISQRQAMLILRSRFMVQLIFILFPRCFQWTYHQGARILSLVKNQGEPITCSLMCFELKLPGGYALAATRGRFDKLVF